MIVRATDKFAKLKNPYTFGVPVHGEGKFFGREEELRLIFDTLENVPRGQKQDLAVLGPRRIGKSSLLHRLVDLLRANKDLVPVYVDVQNIKPKKNRVLFLKVLRAIRRGYQQENAATELPHFETLESGNIPPDLEFLTFDEDMTRLNDLIAGFDLPRSVLMFDEVELLLDIGGIDTLDWFRSLIQSIHYSVFVVAGSERLYSLTQDYGSPFYNIFKTVELHPLKPGAARKLLEVPAADIGMDIPPAQVDTILHYAGNNPYFIQGIAHYLVEELNSQRRRQVYPADANKVIKECITYLSSHLAYIWDGVSQVQKMILYALAQSGRPQTVDALISNLPQLENRIQSRIEQQSVFEDLARQQILKTEKGNYYWFIVHLLADWILFKVDSEKVFRSYVDTFDIRTIRTFLEQQFDDVGFEAFAQDHFPFVFDRFSRSMRKGEKINLLLDYVRRTPYELEELSSLLNTWYPTSYDGSELPTRHSRAEVLLVTVTKIEALAVLSVVKEEFGRELKTEYIGQKTYYDLGTIGGARTFMIRSEMGSGGPSGSFLTVSEGIKELFPSAVIMVGIAFGVDSKKQQIGDILVSKQILEYELLQVGSGTDDELVITLRGDRPSASPRLLDRFRDGELSWDGSRVSFGPVLSGQKIVNTLDFRDKLRKLEPEVLGGEMEGAGLYNAAQRRRVDWILVKAISGWVDGKKHDNKSQRQEEAARNAASFTIRVIEQGGFTSEIEELTPLDKKISPPLPGSQSTPPE